MKKLLFVTDLYYEAKGSRVYCEEDIYLTSQLRKDFQIVICHPEDMENFEADCDLILYRNVGPVARFKEKYQAFRNRIIANELKTYNSFTGKGDMNGKQYIIDLTNANFPVIPTIDTLDDLHKLPNVETYIMKPKDGADSVGFEFVSKNQLNAKVDSNKSMLIQPFVDFEYEVSFYFIDKVFQYALYAPNKDKRWELKAYVPTEEDLAFAQRFVDWNDLDWGIERVDACRTKEGNLLLVEHEDLNPYLSLELLSPEIRDNFVETLRKSLLKVSESTQTVLLAKSF
ncbi:hypothetical protein H9636_18945 [Ureibacillus sp. Re31]|uniref:ATP-grasp domain-containing protein n=1 Tax=Ureibacillus galli TaxID=2762222 RepID=A0ABR8XHJ0_9BACL|nr:hypothetical protein [Ureibacillus galli]MBD8028708.1 hypothetical protein [Ureibacillus galli]